VQKLMKPKPSADLVF